MIRRDSWGIPHLWADSVDELSYRQGHAAAVDRSWQIEVERLRSEGRLASVLGAAELGWDTFARRARLDDTARRCFERLDERTRRWVSSYVDGVNAGLGDTPEFAAAGASPGHWQPWSPLGVFLVQHILFGTFPTKLWRAHAEATLGPAGGTDGSGSNAWTEPGYLAGDPHRIIELPGVYHQVRLACPDFDVLGFAFPGVPGIPHFGHAGPVAWAVTNAMADYQDLYREQLRRVDGRVEVRNPDGWAPAAVHTETIEVRGAEPVPVEIVETPRGPVVEGDLSLRTPTRAEFDLGFSALLPLLHARTAADVEAALAGWVEPVNAVLVQDTTGTTRQLVVGRVPVRDPRNREVPVPGWDRRYAWRGYTSPRSTPVDGVAVTANDRRPDVADLGIDFAAPHRADRIRELLAAGAAPETVHRDAAVHAPGLREVLPRLEPSPLRDRLIAWDGVMSADSRDAAVFAAWRTALVRRLAGHPALRAVFAPGGHAELFRPWTDPAARTGMMLDRLADELPDFASYAAAALSDVTDTGETWGDRHVLSPVHVVPATTPPPAVALSGDRDCVLATSSVPGVSDACWRGPVARYVWDLTDRDRSRWIVPFGASGRPGSPHFADQLPRWRRGELVPVVTDWSRLGVYQETVGGIGRVQLVPVSPATDAPMLHGLVTQRHTRFWGMSEYTVDEVRQVYEFLDGLSTHHAYVVRLDDRPVGIFQSYEPGHDPVGERYDVRPGDIGMHLLLAPGRRPPRGLAVAVGRAGVRFLFQDPSRVRLVVEPDVRNEAAVRRLTLAGFTLATRIDMPGKRAQLAFLTRERFERRYPLP